MSRLYLSLVYSVSALLVSPADSVAAPQPHRPRQVSPADSPVAAPHTGVANSAPPCTGGSNGCSEESLTTFASSSTLPASLASSSTHLLASLASRSTLPSLENDVPRQQQPGSLSKFAWKMARTVVDSFTDNFQNNFVFCPLGIAASLAAVVPGLVAPDRSRDEHEENVAAREARTEFEHLVGYGKAEDFEYDVKKTLAYIQTAASQDRLKFQTSTKVAVFGNAKTEYKARIEANRNV